MSIEDVKAFWENRPCNIKHSDQPIGSLEYFEAVKNKKYKVEPHIIPFSEFEKWKGKEVLEIGSGIGTMMMSFIEHGAIYTGVELSDVSLDLCKQRLKVYNAEADLYLGNAEELSTFLPIKKYDLIYSFGVIHHSPNPKQIIKELTNYLKPDGELRIMLYSFFSYKAFHAMHLSHWHMSSYRDVIRKNAEAQFDCPVAYTYTFNEVKELLNPYFKVEQIWKDHIFIFEIEEYKKGNFVVDKAFEGITDEELKNFEEEGGWHTLCIAKL